MAERAGNPPSRVLGLHSRGSLVYKTACSSSAPGSWGVCIRCWPLGAVGAGVLRNHLSCRKLIQEKLLASQALDIWETVQVAGTRHGLPQGPAEQSTPESGRKIPSQCLSSALYWTKTKFDTHQLAKEHNWDDPLHFCSTDNEDWIWSWETIDWEEAPSQARMPRGGTMIGLAGATPGLLSHLCWEWNCIYKKRKLTDHQAALALLGRETSISDAREIVCSTHQGHCVKPHHGLKKYSSRLSVFFYSNMQLTKKPDVSSHLTKTRWEIDLGGGHIFCCLKRDIIHHNLINQCLMLTAVGVIRESWQTKGHPEELRTRFWTQGTQSGCSPEGSSAYTLDNIAASTFPKEKPCRTYNWVWIDHILLI